MKAIEEQTILITGATDGLGKQAALELAKKGATVLLHGRNPEKTQKTLQEIRNFTGNDKLEYYLADFASLEEVRRLAQDIKYRHDRLDILINNAGIGAGARQARRELSHDDYELRFAVNYLAPFLFTHLILPLVQNSTPSRIINVASVGQDAIDFDDVMLEKSYDGIRAYSQSKLALVMFTFDLAEKLKQDNVTVDCLHPASLMNTKMVSETFGSSMSTVEEGTDALLYLVESSDLDGVTGEFFNGKQRAKADAQAYDEKARQQLWNLSEELTKL